VRSDFPRLNGASVLAKLIGNGGVNRTLSSAKVANEEISATQRRQQ
jgi:hypothetical protein